MLARWLIGKAVLRNIRLSIISCGRPSIVMDCCKGTWRCGCCLKGAIWRRCTRWGTVGSSALALALTTMGGFGGLAGAAPLSSGGGIGLFGLASMDSVGFFALPRPWRTAVSLLTRTKQMRTEAQQHESAERGYSIANFCLTTQYAPACPQPLEVPPTRLSKQPNLLLGLRLPSR